MNKEHSHDKITPTADLICYYRIFSDIPYTKEIAEITNAEKLARNMLKEAFDSSYSLAVMAESRYKKINENIKGYKNILEVAVGRSPRGLIFAQDPTVTYVSTDLPDSLENYRSIMETLIREHNLDRPNLRYAPVHALKLDELKSAADLLPTGPIALISEGFMVYLSNDEKKIFLDNARSILKEKGGILVTPDVLIASNRNPQSDVLAKIAQSSGRDMRDFSFIDQNEAVKFFEDAGFDVVISNPRVSVVSVQALKIENDPSTQRYLNMPVWVLSLKK